MRINWAAIGVVTASAVAGVSGVATIVNASNSITTDVSVMKQIVVTQGADLEKISRRVDYIYERFFQTGGNG